MWGAGCFAPPPHTHPSSPSPRDFTCLLRSSIILVIWIFFLPIVPVSFFSLLLFKNFMLFFSLLFSSLSCSSLFLSLSLLFVPISSKIPASVPARKKEGRGRRVGWALNEMKYGKILRGKKIIKVASWQPQGRVKKDKESVNNVVRTAVFHCRYHANQFLRFCFFFFFFPRHRLWEETALSGSRFVHREFDSVLEVPLT